MFKAANLQTARVIDGKSIARSMRSGIAREIIRMKEATGKAPGLALVLVGKRRDSQTFIGVKLKACNKVGIATFVEELPEGCTEDELLRVVSRLNGDRSVHGIIVQLPLPQVISTSALLPPCDFLFSLNLLACHGKSKYYHRTSNPGELTLHWTQHKNMSVFTLRKCSSTILSCNIFLESVFTHFRTIQIDELLTADFTYAF